MPRSVLTLACVVLAALTCSCGTFQPSDPSQGDESSGSSGSQLPPPDPSDLAIATFNVRRFFDTVCDSGQCDAGDYEEVPTINQFAYKADAITEAIAGMQSDVVILAEVENQNCLDALTERLERDAYPTAVLGESGFAASVDVAVLSRFPTVLVRRHADVPLKRPSGGQTWFSREFLEVHLDAEGHQLIVFAAHFKAKVDDDPERRLAEAMRAREIIDEVAAANPNALIVMGGDLNDTPNSPPLMALLADGGMQRVAEELVPDDWTYSYQGVRQAIDHLLISTAATGGQHLPDTSFVFRGEGNDGYGGSDHDALRASFRAG